MESGGRMTDTKAINKRQVWMLGIIAALALLFAIVRVTKAIVRSKQTLAAAPTMATRTVEPAGAGRLSREPSEPDTQLIASLATLDVPKRDPFSHPKFRGTVVMPSEEIPEGLGPGMPPASRQKMAKESSGFSMERIPTPRSPNHETALEFPLPEQAKPEPTSESDVCYKLLATSLPAFGKAEALLADEQGRRFTAKEGELVADETRLLKIKGREVVLKIGSRLVVVTMKSDDAGENR